MAVAQSLEKFKADIAQCDSLIANAHKQDAGIWLLPEPDRQQITVAAFLNVFIAWEYFLEAAIADYLLGEATISGTFPVRYAQPLDVEHAHKMVIGAGRDYFAYSNDDHVKKLANVYFKGGYPFVTPLNSLSSELADLRKMRNAAAHVSSTTQTAIDTLTLRLLGQPKPGIPLYDLLTTIHPQSNPPDTVFSSYKNKLVVAAELIAQG